MCGGLFVFGDDCAALRCAFDTREIHHHRRAKSRGHDHSILTPFLRRHNLLKMDYRQLITIEPDKRSGQACIRGLRMTVRDVLEYLAAGMTPAQIVDDFPDLTLEDIQACLAYAADRERRLWTVPAA